MANQRINMQKLKKLLELTISGTTRRSISTILGIHRKTVSDYQFLLKNHFGDTFPLLENLSEEELWKIVTLKGTPTLKDDLFLLFPTYEKRLSKVGYTKRLVWEEHISEGKATSSYSQFCRIYGQWEGTQRLTMRMEHKAGDKLFIDFAGTKLHIFDPKTGEKTAVEVFVAILGYSQLTFCQAVYSQKKDDFLTVLANCLTFFGGVTLAIVPDNLKSAVTKASRYEPDINESLADFGEHYQTTIYPTRSNSPKDKSLVEGMVNILYTRVYTQIMKQEFTSLNALNEAIRALVFEHNQKPFQGKTDSRQMRFDQVEQQTLRSLPTTRYELKYTQLAKVHPDCHVKLAVDKRYFSVPYKYCRLQVKLRYTAEVVEIYHNYQRIAIHERFKGIGSHSTIKEHLPPTHQWVMNWSPDFFIKQAEKIGENTAKTIQQVLYSKKYPEQAYKTCAGILALAKKANIGQKRLEDACERVLAYDHVSLKRVIGILDTGLDMEPVFDRENSIIIPLHGNIRGAGHYQ